MVSYHQKKLNTAGSWQKGTRAWSEQLWVLKLDPRGSVRVRVSLDFCTDLFHSCNQSKPFWNFHIQALYQPWVPTAIGVYGRLPRQGRSPDITSVIAQLSSTILSVCYPCSASFSVADTRESVGCTVYFRNKGLPICCRTDSRYDRTA